MYVCIKYDTEEKCRTKMLLLLFLTFSHLTWTELSGPVDFPLSFQSTPITSSTLFAGITFAYDLRAVATGANVLTAFSIAF